MNSLDQNCYPNYNKQFSHIYIESGISEHLRTKRILEHFPDAEKIEIRHYKDVFCRKRQDVAMQREHTALILAQKKEPFLYEGAPVCQDFGEQHFYYTSCAMNCFFDCDYCYLKGMYPSGNIVVFVNPEDTFLELERRLAEHGMYVCISYDTDLLALESLTGFVGEWTRFAKEHPGLVVECRTKCAITEWKRFEVQKNVVFAFTLSPQQVIEAYEHHTPALEERIAAVRSAMEAGFPVRLCFDPMIYVPEWKRHYEAFVRHVAEQIPFGQVKDVSVGTFRISQDYLKNLRKAVPCSPAVQFPFENENGVYHYPTSLLMEMEEFMLDRLRPYVPEQKIFRWNHPEKLKQGENL